MRAVGGPNDGVDVWMPKDKQHIQLLDPVHKPSVYDYNNHSDAIWPDRSIAHYTLYTVRVIRVARPQQSYPDNLLDPQFNELRFLAPHDWSDFKAIHFQFTK